MYGQLEKSPPTLKQASYFSGTCNDRRQKCLYIGWFVWPQRLIVGQKKIWKNYYNYGVIRGKYNLNCHFLLSVVSMKLLKVRLMHFNDLYDYNLNFSIKNLKIPPKCPGVLRSGREKNVWKFFFVSWIFPFLKTLT